MALARYLFIYGIEKKKILITRKIGRREGGGS
jgi:hypothetical protein